ncbi:hypothetical protein [Gordonia sp. QH-12]|uniref:hypothetical protein n=1 Tax=Gordonia sp. QH-12 TaxID=1437876 RepID=UPI000ACFA37A|nr:hypothetical protein [Gordonia sp. QH-12]
MTTTEDLYQQANETYVEYTRRAALALLERAGLRAVVDLVLAARPELNLAATDADASNPEHLRFVNRVLRRCSPNHLAVDRIYIDRIIGATAQAADRLEAEHRAAQEKAAAEAEREKLIEQAARIQCDGWYGEAYFDSLPIGNKVRERYITDCGLLYDAGWRPAPESDGGAA